MFRVASRLTVYIIFTVQDETVTIYATLLITLLIRYTQWLGVVVQRTENSGSKSLEVLHVFVLSFKPQNSAN